MLYKDFDQRQRLLANCSVLSRTSAAALLKITARADPVITANVLSQILAPRWLPIQNIIDGAICLRDGDFAIVSSSDSQCTSLLTISQSNEVRRRLECLDTPDSKIFLFAVVSRGRRKCTFVI